jgi:hypothetical protein
VLLSIRLILPSFVVPPVAVPVGLRAGDRASTVPDRPDVPVVAVRVLRAAADVVLDVVTSPLVAAGLTLAVAALAAVLAARVTDGRRRQADARLLVIPPASGGGRRRE